MCYHIVYSRHHSDYGYKKLPHESGCTKLKDYDLSKHCTVGQKTYLKSSTGRRLIPGDLCTNPEAFATFTNETCTGYDSKEYDSGVNDDSSNGSSDNQRNKV